MALTGAGFRALGDASMEPGRRKEGKAVLGMVTTSAALEECIECRRSCAAVGRVFSVPAGWRLELCRGPFGRVSVRGAVDCFQFSFDRLRPCHPRSLPSCASEVHANTKHRPITYRPESSRQLEYF